MVVCVVASNAMSIVFDRAVPFYDRTRGLPEAAQRELAQLVRERTALDDRSVVLEVGVGTGRIALPLVRANGYRYIGVDLAREMLEALLQKAAGHQIGVLRGDITQLPLASGACDAVVAVHIFHLVPGWRAALDEVARVLRLGGVLLHGRNADDTASPTRRLRARLDMLSGADEVVVQDGRLAWPEVRPELEARFGAPEVATTEPWTVTRTAREILSSYGARVWSHTWRVPDDRLAAAVAAAEPWASAEFGSLDAPLVEHQRFMWEMYAGR